MTTRREETVIVTKTCDAQLDCDGEARFTSDDGPYDSGWRMVTLRVYNKYKELGYDNYCTVDVCPQCVEKLKPLMNEG